MKLPTLIHVALIDAHPTEADARTALDTGEAYLGIWAPPGGEPAHVFGDDVTAADLGRAGWVRT